MHSLGTEKRELVVEHKAILARISGQRHIHSVLGDPSTGVKGVHITVRRVSNGEGRKVVPEVVTTGIWFQCVVAKGTEAMDRLEAEIRKSVAKAKAPRADAVVPAGMP